MVIRLLYVPQAGAAFARLSDYAVAALVLVMLLLSRDAAAEPVALCVLFPEIHSPYREVFQQIVAGADAATADPVVPVGLNEQASTATVRARVREEGCKAVVALGQRGLEIARGLDDGLSVAVGAVLQVSEADRLRFAGISYVPHPRKLFARLREIAPKVTRVFVVYNSRENGWLIDMARMAASAQGLEFNALPADDLRSAAHQFKSVFARADAASNAVWLLHDGATVDDKVILPMILAEAWRQNVVVFSSNVGHVRNGVLFSMYPDNMGLGGSLARLALGGAAEGAAKPGSITPLEDLLTAANLRTASHLGLDLARQQGRGIDLVFPSQ